MALNVITKLFFLAFCSVIVGCKSKSSSVQESVVPVEKQTPVINFENISDDPSRMLRMSDLVASIEYIRPEYPKTLIRFIEKSILTDSLLFVLSSDNLFCYSRDGKFIREIGHHGRGPTEHLGIRSFSVYQNTVAINSNFSKIIQLYDLNGKHIGSTPSGGDAYRIDLLSNESIALHLGHGISLKKPDLYISRIINYQGDTLAIKNVTPDYQEGRSNPSNFWYYKDSLRIWNGLNDTVFSVTNNKIEPRYILNFGKYKMAPEVFYDYQNRDRAWRHYILNPSFHETEKYLLIMYQYNNKIWVSCYEKATNQLFSWSQEPEYISEGGYADGGLLNDIDGGKPFYFGMSQSGIKVTSSAAGSLIEYANSGKINKNSNELARKKLEALIASLSEEENDVVIVHTLKP